jgi:hypothetical protein
MDRKAAAEASASRTGPTFSPFLLSGTPARAIVKNSFQLSKQKQSKKKNPMASLRAECFTPFYPSELFPAQSLRVRE